METPVKTIVPYCYDNNNRNDLTGDLSILQALADLHGDVKDAECSVKDSIMVSNSQRQTAELNLHNRLCEAEKASIEAKWAGITQTKETESRLLARVEECCCDNKMMNLDLKQFVTEKFCDLERRELEDEVSELKQNKVDSTNDGILNTLNAILLKLK